MTTRPCLLAVLTLAACAPELALPGDRAPDAPDETDTPAVILPADGAAPAVDASPPTDASSAQTPDTVAPPVDTGAPSDAPPPSPDVPPAETGVPRADSGTPPTDTGACPVYPQWERRFDAEGVRCVCVPGVRNGVGCDGQDTDCDGRADTLASCGGFCRDLRNDPLNCGVCGRSCGINGVCRDGACGCATGMTACGNGCFAFPSNRERCAYCARYCLGRDRPECCAMACAATTACGA